MPRPDRRRELDRCYRVTWARTVDALPVTVVRKASDIAVVGPRRGESCPGNRFVTFPRRWGIVEEAPIRFSRHHGTQVSFLVTI